MAAFVRLAVSAELAEVAVLAGLSGAVAKDE